MRLLPILAIFLFIACRPHAYKCLTEYKDFRSWPTEIDKEVKPYYQSFKEDYGLDVSHIPAEFMHLEGQTAGVCVHNHKNEPGIYLDPVFWRNIADSQKENLVYHELGHCFFGRDHTEKMVTIDGERIPESIMNPYILDYSLYVRYHEYYVIELVFRSEK